MDNITVSHQKCLVVRAGAKKQECAAQNTSSCVASFMKYWTKNNHSPIGTLYSTSIIRRHSQKDRHCSILQGRTNFFPRFDEVNLGW